MKIIQYQQTQQATSGGAALYCLSPVRVPTITWWFFFFFLMIWSLNRDITKVRTQLIYETKYIYLLPMHKNVCSAALISIYYTASRYKN